MANINYLKGLFSKTEEPNDKDRSELREFIIKAVKRSHNIHCTQFAKKDNCPQVPCPDYVICQKAEEVNWDEHFEEILSKIH